MSRGRATDLLRIAVVWLGVLGQIVGGYIPIALGWSATIGHRSAEYTGRPDTIEIPLSLQSLMPLTAKEGEADSRRAAIQRLSQLGFLDRRRPDHLEVAIKDFQHYKELPPTGDLDASTCAALNNHEPQND